MLTLEQGDAIWIEDGYAGAPHAAVVTAVSDRTVYAESAERIPNDSRVLQWTIQRDHVAGMVSLRTER